MLALDRSAFVHPESLERVAPSGLARDGDLGGEALSKLAAPGRLIELCGAARTSAAVSILAGVQRAGETAAWIQLAGGDLYPPDLAAAGIDLDALIVIQVPVPAPSTSTDRSPRAGRSPHAGRRQRASVAAEQCRCAELLLRSGGFGLVILDFRHGEPSGSTAWQGRLLGQARQHEARVVLIRQPDPREASAPTPGAANGPAPAHEEHHPGSSLGPLVSLRVRSEINREDPTPRPAHPLRTRLSRMDHEVLKNKSGGPVRARSEGLRGPWGLS